MLLQCHTLARRAVLAGAQSSVSVHLMSESAVSIPALSAHAGTSGSILTSHMGNGQVPRYELGSIFERPVSQ